jgi:hypothetical protein
MSEYLAVLAFGPALRQTYDQFWPPRPGQIVRLLIISFFIGAWITSPVPGDISSVNIPYFSQLSGITNMPAETGLITTVMIAILVILSVYALFSSIFQFIFVDYLSSGKTRIFSSFKTRAGMGIRLLGFYLVTILLIGICAVVAILLITIPVLTSTPANPTKVLLALMYTLIGLLFLIIPIWILTIITTDFVVPVMIVQRCGIIHGLEIIRKEFSGRWEETGIYLLIKIAINLVTGVLMGVLLVTIMEGLGFSSFILIPGMQTTGSISLMDFLLPFALMGVITLIVMTPVVTFFRYYSLVFLELLSDTYALLPEVYKNQ